MSYVSEQPFVHHDRILAGDFSCQRVGDHVVLAYGLVGTTVDRLQALESGLNALVARVAGDECATAELHAKQIWNGSERSRTPFRRLWTKSNMLDFFMSVSETIRSVPIDVVVALNVYSNTLSRREVRQLKTELPGFALAQLDDNVKAQSGKHVGQPTLMLDIEGASSPGQMTDHPYLTFAHRVPNTPEDRLEVFRSACPTYIRTESSHSRLVQTADVAAYFAAKYLVLFGTVVAHIESTDREIAAGVGAARFDCNSVLGMWDALNMDVILVRSKHAWSGEPLWLRHFWQPYSAFFERYRDLIATFLWPLRLARYGRHPTVAYWPI